MTEDRILFCFKPKEWKKAYYCFFKSTGWLDNWPEVSIRDFDILFHALLNSNLSTINGRVHGDIWEIYLNDEALIHSLTCGQVILTAQWARVPLRVEMCPAYKWWVGRNRTLNRTARKKRGNTHGKYVAESCITLHWGKRNGTPKRAPPPAPPRQAYSGRGVGGR